MAKIYLVPLPVSYQDYYRSRWLISLLVASPAFENSSSLLETPSLLHLAHPYALTNLQRVFAHVKSFRQFLGSKAARGENAQIAKDVLVNLVDCSGVDINALGLIVAECIQDAQAIPGK